MQDAIDYLQHNLYGLKDFQKATVKQILKSFNDPNHSHRVLVADEVGLGKTIVARGVINELLKDRLSNGSSKGPMRVAYICSNQALATENRRKLNIFSNATNTEQYIQEPTFNRLVELAIEPNKNSSTDKKLLEIASLTPSTSFTLTHGDGNVRERFIIYSCLMQNAQLSKHDDKIKMVFCNGVKSWEDQSAWLQTRGAIDESIVKIFFENINRPIYTNIDNKILDWLELNSHPTAIELLVAIGLKATETSLKDELQRKWLYRFRGIIRSKLAQACAQNLKADLFILDEFQRFSSLLHSHEDSERSEVSIISDQIFNLGGKPKILLLSATPFKAINTIHENERENKEPHHKEFSKLFKFLTNGDEEKLAKYQKERSKLLQQIQALNNQSKLDDMDNSAKTNIEALLKPYICRTERSQISENFDEIYQSNPNPQCFDTFSQDDITYYRSMTNLTSELDKIDKSRQSSQLLHFYKAAPWALSFMSGYQLRARLERYLDHKKFQSAIASSSDSWVPKDKIENYSLNLSWHAPNAKLRSLVDVVFKPRSEELLWLPPTKPWYPHEGPFKENERFSKTLLFSAWAMVPRALSGLLSYEAERRLQTGMPNYYKKNYGENDRENKTDIIHFKADSIDALVAWSMIYPSKSLIDLPCPKNSSSLDSIITERADLISNKLIPLASLQGENKEKTLRHVNTLWYAIAPLLLDKILSPKWLDEWLNNEINQFIDTAGRSSHLRDIKNHLEDPNLSLGTMPNDLPQYLALLSVASPSICAARMLQNIWSNDTTNLMNQASNIGLSILQMFNKSESQNILNKVYGNKKKYWFQIIEYCADGNIQAMLYEYGHLLNDSGVSYEHVAERIANASGFQTTTVSCQFDSDKHKKVDRHSENLRCHYAVPLGIQKTTEEAQVRITHIRDAFNSPFKPFVLNSTSIGQEGLDFHWYCNRVVHWNLPSNPIDIEQREGRVNRYKSLVVRRRLIEFFTSHLLKHNKKESVKDEWKQVFDFVDAMTKNSRDSDLVPYWHIPLSESNNHIERIILMMPMSREVERLEQMFKALSMYRLTFGQPRQQDLLQNLLNHNFTDDTIKAIKQKFIINLAPISYQ